MELQRYEKFEYTYKQFNGYSISKIVDELNKLGQEGWELISNIKDEIDRPRYILKRKLICELTQR